MKIDPGVGYRLLNEDEVIREGDEWYNQLTGDMWIPERNKTDPSIGKTVRQDREKFENDHLFYRRRLEVEAGFRLLGDHEIIAEGDNWLTDIGLWATVGKWIGYSVQVVKDHFIDRTVVFRRLLSLSDMVLEISIDRSYVERVVEDYIRRNPIKPIKIVSAPAVEKKRFVYVLSWLNVVEGDSGEYVFEQRPSDSRVYDFLEKMGHVLFDLSFEVNKRVLRKS